MTRKQLDTTTSSTAAERELSEQYWNTMARTADLVSKLTSLADRYDLAVPRDPVRAASSRDRVALMRTAAESGRQLIRSLAPPALPPGTQPEPSVLERADRARHRDVQASRRDAAAEGRDGRAVDRDVRARAATGDQDAAFPGRFLAACDRDSAAGDRADAFADRRAAHVDREQAGTPVVPDIEEQAQVYALFTRLEERTIVRQAQGILMQRYGLTAGEAFEALLVPPPVR